MKKIFSGILVLLLAVAMFADSKEVVDGVIEVADSGKFPSGHFGQAAGYLPGDSVFVTNPESGVTLQFLNLGTLDSADGVVILLSDESAKTLGIAKGSGMRCKLNMRYGSFDETVVGQAVIDAEDAALAKKAKKTEAPKSSETSAPDASVPVAVEAPVAAVAVAPVAGIPLFESDDSSSETEEPVEIIEEAAEEEPVAEEAVAEEPVAEEAVAEEIVSAETTEEENFAVEAIPEEVAAEEAVALESSPEAEETVDGVVIEDYENEDAAFAETRVAVEQPSPAEASEAEELAVEEPVAVETLSVIPVPAGAEAVVEEELPALEEETAPVEVAAVEEVAEETSTETPADEYAPIVLVPADPVAPEATEEVATRSAESAVSEVSAAPVVVPAPAPVAEVPVAAPVVTREATPSSRSETYRNYIVDSEDSLKKNCWYVQIASLGNPENLENTVRKYSKYPIILVPNGRGAYRVLIGPLGKDEYAAVLTKFKAYGYKDAFLKRK